MNMNLGQVGFVHNPGKEGDHKYFEANADRQRKPAPRKTREERLAAGKEKRGEKEVDSDDELDSDWSDSSEDDSSDEYETDDPDAPRRSAGTELRDAFFVRRVERACP